MRIIIYKFGVFPDQVAKLVRLHYCWVLAVPASDKKKAIVAAMESDRGLEVNSVINDAGANGVNFCYINFTAPEDLDAELPDVVYEILSDAYKSEIKQLEV